MNHARSGSRHVSRLSALWIASLAGGVSAQVAFTPLPTLGASHTATPRGMSSDGSVIAGWDTFSSTMRAVCWSGGAITEVGVDGYGAGVSPAGDFIVGSAQPYSRAFRWSPASGITYLANISGSGSPPQTSASATNGVDIVGAVWGDVTIAAIWRNGALSSIAGGGTTLLAGSGITTDGTAACVNGITSACKWVSPGTVVSISNAANPGTTASGISGNGQIIVGAAYDSFSQTVPHAYRWTSATGCQRLPVTAGTTQSAATAVSTDGATIVGWISVGPDQRAAIWLSDGAHLLEDLLAPYSVVPAGWHLATVNGVSSDGLVVTGTGAFGGLSLPFVADLPGFCYANCDRSTVAPALNVADFFCFLNAFASGSPYANCDGSTGQPTLNILDFTCFLNRFAAGCP